jgi:hypothetical protein
MMISQFQAGGGVWSCVFYLADVSGGTPSMQIVT